MRALGSVTVLLLAAAPAAAQPPKATAASPVPTSLFLVYALEDLYRAPLPADAELFEAFVARQQVQYDQLLLYLSKQKTRDAELVAQFDDYRKVLDRVRELLKEVEACQKKHYGPVVQARLKLQYEEMRQANAVVFTGLAYGLGALSRGSSDDEALRQGLSAAMVRAIDARYQVEAARNDARAAIRKAVRDFEAELKTFYPQKKGKLQKELRDGPQLSAELLGRVGWPKDVDFAAAAQDLADWGDGAKPANPLWIERVVLTRKAPEGLAAIDFHHRNAKDFLFAARMVPAPAAFNAYRARLYSLAGLSANRSAAAQIGQAGFKGAAADAAKTSIEAWNGYFKLEPIPVTDCELRHQAILAYSYGGLAEKTQALNLIRLVMKEMGVHPAVKVRGPLDTRFVTLRGVRNAAFWYDAARLLSLARDVPAALSCFYAAVHCGFRDYEAARVHPDLALLRAGAPDAFNRLVTPPKK